MSFRTLGIAISLLLALASWSQGQVVQLPTFDVFSINTTVVVPDRGGAFLGGVSRARYDSNSAGVPGFSKIPGLSRLFTNRSIRSSASASNAYVSATIHDLQEMDRAILAAAASRNTVNAEDLARQRKAAFLAQHIGRGTINTARPPRPLPARTSDRGMVVKRTVSPSAPEVFATARSAEAAGRLGAARIGYRRVERMDRGDLQAKARQRLSALEKPAPAIEVAVRTER